MSDPATELLLALYETHRATAYSNLFVGIIFGEWAHGDPLSEFDDFFEKKNETKRNERNPPYLAA
jgi:hypothetical protein